MPDIVPSGAIGAWAPNVSGGAGVNGGIPTNRTQSGSTITSTGGNQTTEINNAIAAASAGTYVLLAAGTFTAAVDFGSKNDVTLRGAGSGQLNGEAETIIVGSIDFGTGDWNHGTPTAISGSPTRGTTTLTVASSSGFSANILALIKLDNDTSDIDNPIIQLDNVADVREQLVRIVSVPNGTSVVITPALAFDLPTGLSPTIEASTTLNYGIGIEDLVVDQGTISGNSKTIGAWQVRDCWLKNVGSRNADSYHIDMLYWYNCEIANCWVDDSATHVSNGSGIRMLHSCSNLIYNNIIEKVFPSVEVNKGCVNNVIAYNYCLLSDAGDPTTQAGAAIDTNHDSHNNYNLYEGNVTQNFQCDGYFGSTSNDVIARNWAFGYTSQTNNNWFCMGAMRFTRGYYIVGNVWGDTAYSWTVDPTTSGIAQGTHFIYMKGFPNMGNRSFTGTAELSEGDAWADWADYAAGTYSGGAGAGGFQERDLDVVNLNTILGNWNAEDEAIPAGESLGADTVADSYYLSGKPDWFGLLTWPPINAPDGQPAVLANVNPATYRYVNGQNPPEPASGITVTNSRITSLVVGG